MSFRAEVLSRTGGFTWAKLSTKVEPIEEKSLVSKRTLMDRAEVLSEEAEEGEQIVVPSVYP